MVAGAPLQSAFIDSLARPGETSRGYREWKRKLVASGTAPPRSHSEPRPGLGTCIDPGRASSPDSFPANCAVFELVINLKTAKALGIIVHQTCSRSLTR